MIRILSRAIAISMPLIVFAAGSAGTTGFELFRMDGFAGSAALGGSQVAAGGRLHSLYTNPAGISSIGNSTGGVGYTKHVLDLNSGLLAYTRPVKKLGTVGGMITYFDYGNFDRADENGQKLGEFGASDILISGSVAREVKENVDAGVTVKYQNRNIDSYTASAIAADLGFLYHTGYEGWDVGGGIFNFGTALSAFLNEKDDLPVTYKLGFSVPLEHLPVQFSIAGAYTEFEGIEGSGGLEISFAEQVRGRLGYNTVGIDQRTGLSSDALAGFSGGLGVSIRSLSFDYALTSQGEIGFLNRFTLSSRL